MIAVRPLDTKLLRDLWHVRGQALAIATVVACGVAIVVMTFGAMRSLEITRDTYYERYRFADLFSQLKRAPLRVVNQVAAIPGVAAAEARITHYAALDIPELHRPASAYLVSLPEFGEPRLNMIALREGRLPQRDRDEVVMSENMAKALGYHPGHKIAVLLGGRKRSFKIVGIALSPEFVYVLGPGQLMPDDRAFGIIWVSRPLMEAAYNLDGAFNDVSVSLTPGVPQSDVIQRLDKILARYGGAAAYGREDQTSHAFITQELDQLRTIATVIPPIFLGVAAFLIHMVMTRLVDTERESIGLLKAAGYTNWEIGRHYLKFSLLIASLGILLGAIAGLLLGRWMTLLYQEYFRFPFLEYRLDPSVFASAIFIAVVSAIAGTWNAVSRAVKLAPAVAMLPPAPPIYHRTWVERLGLDRHLSMPTHMIVRHIERWPLRAFLTSAGVAMAIMLLVGLFFFFDAIDELVDTFYFRSNRHDIVIGLVEQRSQRAWFDASRLPGVRVAEPVLEIQVRLSSGHLTQKLVITGLNHDSQLRAFYDSAGRPLTIPGNGIVLSNKLADLLRLDVGDRVQLEPLEGTRTTSLPRVTAIVSEHVGVAAYMDRQALAKLAGETGGITAINALVDDLVLQRLFERLKENPAVATVATRSQAVSALRENMARSMTIVIDFYIGLGAIISFGVLYNATRISLSERGRELASLRVLGFSRTEVSYILLGELALLVIAAMPVGCALGYGLAWLMSQAMETKLFRVPFVVAPATFGIAMSIALISAALSAIIVGWRINRLDLVAVLKTRE